MPLNISDVEDAFLGGSADWEEFLNEFLPEWFAPVGEVMFGAAMATLPPEVAEQLRKIIPEQMQEVQEKFGGTHGKTT